jgi:hypothetical protein
LVFIGEVSTKNRGKRGHVGADSLTDRGKQNPELKLGAKARNGTDISIFDLVFNMCKTCAFVEKRISINDSLIPFN